MASVQPPGFPVSVNVARFDVDGAPTDVVVSKYEDCVMLVASQIGAFGTILSASCPALLRITTWLNLGGRPDASAEGRTTYSTTVLLGKRDEPLLTLAARQLVEASVEAGNTRPLTVSLGLKHHTLGGVKQLVGAIKDGGLLR
ncbi:hypothetical protein MNEG_0436 [Monoraphidium neglectum]|uniref:Uncharacterized protein n=1 Tax=Monoraphidium neglectum TaxID=145388 RepID=A0A0D2KBE2_9CHLO|nr:hypothetical protein MNEG_0436 [Monoraphidium neglectum]KIZ07523.1 hypothetical protein MNEG_0436 [Monoraphidium neglectum]|eukprot:XP_013906542.1 hypothetical protein MNEG_0436 [Monoraphidium neglectum]